MRTEAFTTAVSETVLEGRVHRPAKSPAPLVVCSHGLFSSMAGSKLTAIAESLAHAGFTAVCYDHRGCGRSGGRIEDTTVSGRLADLQAVLLYWRDEIAAAGFYGLIGSSMGGYISLFTAAADPCCRAAVVWAAPWQLKGRPQAFQTPEHPSLGPAFFSDLAGHHLAPVLGRIRRCLFLHGRADSLVPCWHAERNYAGAGEPKRLELFQDGDHRFSRPEDRRRAIELSVDWMRRYLSEDAEEADVQETH